MFDALITGRIDIARTGQTAVEEHPLQAAEVRILRSTPSRPRSTVSGAGRYSSFLSMVRHMGKVVFGLFPKNFNRLAHNLSYFMTCPAIQGPNTTDGAKQKLPRYRGSLFSYCGTRWRLARMLLETPR